MKVKNLINLFFVTLSTLVLSGCLPTQKTTQCGKDEAFNSTKRVCVPVVSAASTSTVFIKSKLPSNSYTTSINSASSVHSISVSDVYEYGHTSKWFLHYSSGASNNTSQVASNTLSYTFNPSFLYGAGNYVLEAVIYNDDGDTLDSASWNITINGDQLPELINPSPSAGSHSYSSMTNSATLTMDINNPDGVSGSYFWSVNGDPTETGSTSGTFNSTTTSFSTTISPQGLTRGIHTVELRITNSVATNNIYDSYVWIINVISPDMPSLTSASPAYSYTLIAMDGISYSDANGGFFYDHDGDDSIGTPLENIATKTQTGDTPGLCVNVDNWDKDGDGNPDIYLVFEINGAVQGGNVPMTANQYCHTTQLNTQNLVNPEIGASKTLTVTSYETTTGNELEQKQWALNIVPLNVAPVIKISNNTDSFGCVKTSDVLHQNCDIIQSVDNNLDGDYSDTGDVPNTIKLAIDVVSDSETDYTNDTASNGENANIIRFQIKRDGDASWQDMDSSSGYTSADCNVSTGVSKTSSTDGSTPSGSVTTYFCNLNMDAFNANGPIAAGDFTVRANITDAGSVWGGIAKDSNYVQWEMTSMELQSAPDIQTQDFTSSSIIANRSYLSSSSNGAGCSDSGTVLYNGNSINEGEYVLLHTFVKDLERDHLSISVELENRNNSPGFLSEVSSHQTVTRVDGDEYLEIVTCFLVPEWANTTGTQNLIVQPSVWDSPDNSATKLNDSQIMYLRVANINPAPAFADSSDRNLSLDSLGAAEQTYVVSGFPFSLTPPSYSDSSVYDGKTVSWKWQVCAGNPATTCASSAAAWNDIPGADTAGSSSEDLNWTPSASIPAGSTINLRICLGDDGDGNPADCDDARPQSRKTYTNIIANPASFQPASDAPTGDQLASWFDATNAIQYIAYTSGTRIYLQKMTNDDTTGAWSLVHSIYFDSDETSPRVPEDLSIIGQDGVSILIAYRIPEAGTDNPVPRVRRIDISAGKMSFNATGLYDATDTGDLDMITGTADGDAPSTATYVDSGDGSGLNITFSAAPTPTEGISFRLADGAGTVTIDYQNGSGWCDSACANATDTATELAAAINAHPRLSQEISATPTGTSVQITGPAATEFIDLDSSYAIALGNITIQNNNWYIPFTDGSNSSKASIAMGTNPNMPLNAFVPSVKKLSTKSAMTELVLKPNNAGEMLLLGQASANAHAYLLDSNADIIESSENIFDLTGMLEIKDLDLSVDANDTVFISGISENASSETYLSAAVLNSDLSSASATTRFIGTSNAATLNGAQKAAIAASSLPDGSAVIALTTNSDSVDIPLEARFIRISQDTADYTQPIILDDYQISSTPSSPKLGALPVYEGSSIALSPMLDQTKGNSDESDGVAADNTQASVYFTYFENDSSLPEIRTGVYNVAPTDISTDDDTVSGSYPAFVSN